MRGMMCRKGRPKWLSNTISGSAHGTLVRLASTSLDSAPLRTDTAARSWVNVQTELIRRFLIPFGLNRHPNRFLSLRVCVCLGRNQVWSRSWHKKMGGDLNMPRVEWALSNFGIPFRVGDPEIRFRAPNRILRHLPDSRKSALSSDSR